MMGMPECNVVLAQCALYLARAPKSIAVYDAYEKTKALVMSAPAYPVPLHIRNPETKLNRDLGYGAGYIYNPTHEGPVNQQYFPEELKGTKLFDPAKIHPIGTNPQSGDAK
jgi:putative ATPase